MANALPRSARRALIAFLVGVTVLVAIDSPAEAAGPSPATNGTLGIDVASHQHPGGKAIDWSAVRRFGVRFVYVKANEGPDNDGPHYTNPWFKRDWAGAGNAGLARGAYHYARPRLPTSTGAADARHFVNTIGRTGELPPALDLEEAGALSRTQLIAWVRSWLTTVENLTGVRPIVYTARWYWNSYLSGSKEFSSYKLWVARYDDGPGTMPGGWTGWNFWQYSASGRIPGIAAEVDLNISCPKSRLLGTFCAGATASSGTTKKSSKTG